MHGFDEFFGNLYHLNAEEEPENFNYPRDPRFREQFGPRGVLRCKATDVDDPTEDPRWGRVGRQTIEDTGPLTRKRMETIDDETSDAAVDYIKRQVAAASRSSAGSTAPGCTHARAGGTSRPARLTARTEYCRWHDRARRPRRQAIQALDDLGIANDTIVLTDRQRPAHELAGRRDDPVPQQKNTNWEGAFRVLHDPLAGPDRAGTGLAGDRQRARLVSDALGRGRRSGRQGEATDGPRGGRQDLQGPPRRLQPAAVSDRSGAAERA